MKNEIRKPLVLMIACLSLLILAGCAHNPFCRDYEKAVKRYREDVLTFYDSLSDAYFILGYEYYELAGEFEEKGDPERAAYFQDKATIYYNLSKDLKNAAAETRKFSRAEEQ